MRLSWKLGRLAGIDLYLHPSVLLLGFVVAGFVTPGLATVALAVALCASIVLHELGHALTARLYGIETVDITLYGIGGVARLRRMPRSSGPELLIALAGPAVSLALAVVFGGLAYGLEPAGLELATFLGVVSGLNLSFGLFNLIPAFPMDGGRILRALLSTWVGRLRATEIAALLGRVLAVVGGIYFVSQGSYLPLLLVVFLYRAGSIELRQVRAEESPSQWTSGFAPAPPPPAGFRWSNGADGVWRLVPNAVRSGGRGPTWN